MNDAFSPILTKLTPTLRALISQYEKTYPPEDVTAFLEHLHTVAVGYRERLLASGEGAPRAKALHDLMDEVLKQIGDVKPTCTAGCGACCHFEVEITREEGQLLAGLVEAGHPIDRERLESQASRERLSPEWKKLKVPGNRCVFLGDQGNCTVYAERPSACRKLLVVSSPEECGKPDGVPVPITIPLAELVLSTMISLPGVEFMSLSKAVRAGLAPPGSA